MDLSPTADQIAILDALDSLAKPYASVPLHDTSLSLTSDALDRELAEGGFLDVAFDPDLGAVTAALVIERLARLPFATEAALSALVRPLFSEMAGPICVVEADRTHRPLRFLRAGATVVVVGAETVSSFLATADQVRAEDSLFAYPMGTLLIDPATATRHDVSPAAVKMRWRIALAAESAGLLAAALASVSAHVTEREQFGRPLATFQALRHRLAEAQVRINGVYWLAVKAAATLEAGDAAIALLHAQETARACLYDFHQFMGAMGMTLEHPLHLWTYRLKALASELGKRGGQALAAADAAWGESADGSYRPILYHSLAGYDRAKISMEPDPLPDIATPNLPSRNFDQTAEFFGKLGFIETWRDAGWMILKRGGITLEFFPYPDLDPAKSSFSCCFRMQDVGVFFADIKEAGVPEVTAGWPRTHKPKREPWGGVVGALIDPDGTLIRLVQAPD